MGKDELLDSHVSANQANQAIEALHSHITKKQKQVEDSELLPPKETFVWLNVTVKNIPKTHSFKPVRIPVKHPLVDPRASPICLLTKDPQSEYKKLLSSHQPPINFISRVIGLSKLKGKFSPFEARRLLLKEYGLFLADDRITSVLPRVLGVKWFDAKKQPIPVNLKRKDLKAELERAVNSTYMHQNRGTCTAIKLSSSSHTPAQTMANFKIALPAIIHNIKGGWDNVQALHIKSSDSVALPIWVCEKEKRWDVTVEDNEAEDAEAAEEEEWGGLGRKSDKGKGRKRQPSADDGDEEEDAMDVVEEQPKKKKAKVVIDGSAKPSSEKSKGKSEGKKVKPKETDAIPKTKNSTTPRAATSAVESKSKPKPQSSSKASLPKPNTLKTSLKKSTSVEKTKPKSSIDKKKVKFLDKGGHDKTAKTSILGRKMRM